MEFLNGKSHAQQRVSLSTIRSSARQEGHAQCCSLHCTVQPTAQLQCAVLRGLGAVAHLVEVQVVSPGGGVRQAHHNQPLHHLWVQRRCVPGHHAAPVMRHQHAPAAVSQCCSLLFTAPPILLSSKRSEPFRYVVPALSYIHEVLKFQIRGNHFPVLLGLVLSLVPDKG